MNNGNPNEKRDTRFIFACVGGILYIVPSLSCLAFGILSDGMSPKFILTIITLLCALPVSFLGMYFYRKKTGKAILISICAVHIMLHIASLIACSAWYLILLPDLVLTMLIMTHSGALDKLQ